MNENASDTSEIILQKARQALLDGNRAEARRLAVHAARLAPQDETVWLTLADIVEPEDRIKCFRKALEVNPTSQIARQAIHQVLKEQRASNKHSLNSPNLREEAQAVQTVSLNTQKPPVPIGRHVAGTVPQVRAKPPHKKTTLLKIALMLGTFFALGVIILSAAFIIWLVTSTQSIALAKTPMLDSLNSWFHASPTPAMEPAEINHFGITPSAAALNPTITQTPFMPVDKTFTPIPTVIIPTGTALPTAIIPEPIPPLAPALAESAALPVVDNPDVTNAVSVDDRWIDVDLGDQRMYAYLGNELVRTFVISSGTNATPTLTGQFRIYVKYESTDMSGPGYFLPSVPHVMYFYKDYGIHAAYWHMNFGTPMSHGCVNMKLDDADWLYSWASVGTLVNIHD